MDSQDDENVRIEANSVTKKVINTTSTSSYELQKAVAEHPDLLETDIVDGNTARAGL